jgi:hypothetical protein
VLTERLAQTFVKMVFAFKKSLGIVHGLNSFEKSLHIAFENSFLVGSHHVVFHLNDVLLKLLHAVVFLPFSACNFVSANHFKTLLVYSNQIAACVEMLFVDILYPLELAVVISIETGYLFKLSWGKSTAHKSSN